MDIDKKRWQQNHTTMTDLSSTNKSIKNKKTHLHKNLILIFGIGISLIVISSFFPFTETGLNNVQKSNERAPKIHESDTVALINQNRKMHHNFLASYLMQESGLDRKSVVYTNNKGIFSDLSSRIVIPVRQLFGFK